MSETVTKKVNLLNVMRVDQLPPVDQRDPPQLTLDQIELLRGILAARIIHKGQKEVQTLEKLSEAQDVTYSQNRSALEIKGTVRRFVFFRKELKSVELARLQARTELQIDGQNALQYRVNYNQFWAVKLDDDVLYDAIQIVEKKRVIQQEKQPEQPNNLDKPDSSPDQALGEPKPPAKIEETRKAAEKESPKPVEKKEEETLPSLPAEERSIFSKAIGAIVYVATLPIRGLLLLLDWLLGPEETETVKA